MGYVLLVTRRGGELTVRFTNPASFTSSIEAEDPGAAERLSQAYRSGGTEDVKSLVVAPNHRTIGAGSPVKAGGFRGALSVRN